MQQYIDLLKAIIKDGTYKAPAREGMPGTWSLFGYQFRHTLDKGFPLLTTKKMFWKGVVIELLWFLKGDTNIKYLIDNGVNIWNEDAYNYYVKIQQNWLKRKHLNSPENLLLKKPLSFEDFLTAVKTWKDSDNPLFDQGYCYGDLPNQYGETWRRWEYVERAGELGLGIVSGIPLIKDQIVDLIKGLKETPMSRRHVVTSINPTVEPALYWCHAMFQFNCREIKYFEGDGVCYGEQDKFYRWVIEDNGQNEWYWVPISATSWDEIEEKYPKYYLDCSLYQRSADAVLGVPFNIASYALLTHIIATICDMLPGDFIHSFGDVHIYANHKDAVKEQLSRNPLPPPMLSISGGAQYDLKHLSLDQALERISHEDFQVYGYNPLPAIKAELSTGMIKKLTRGEVVELIRNEFPQDVEVTEETVFSDKNAKFLANFMQVNNIQIV